MKEGTVFDKSKHSVRFFDFDVIKPFVEKHHYLHQVEGAVVRCCYGAINEEESQLVGVMIYGEPVRCDLGKSISPYVRDNEILELLRVIFLPDTGKNIESWAIAKSFKMLPDDRKVVVSYSDPSVGHHGGIYQALNGIYQNLPGRDGWQVSLDGGQTWFHERKQGRWWGKHSLEDLKRKLPKPFQLRRNVRKYRYTWLLGYGKHSDTEYQKVFHSLRHPVSPYPDKIAKRQELEIITITE